MRMTRKTKAAWIGFFVPVILGWAVVLYAYIYAYFEPGNNRPIAVYIFGIPSILFGGVIAAIAAAYTKNKREATAALIGFLVPVIVGWSFVLYAYLEPGASGWFSPAGYLVASVWMFGIPSILVGAVIAAIAAGCVKNKDRDPLKCAGCGYSLAGIESGECPECGKKTS